jgi:hypothetical protein
MLTNKFSYSSVNSDPLCPYAPANRNISTLRLQKDLLPVKVNKLTSIKTQLPYSFYSLPFCKPDTIVDSAENLGEVLRGDRIENSAYVVCFSPSIVCFRQCIAQLALVHFFAHMFSSLK